MRNCRVHHAGRPPPPTSQPVSILKQKKVLVPRTIPPLRSFVVMTNNIDRLFKKNNEQLVFGFTTVHIPLLQRARDGRTVGLYQHCVPRERNNSHMFCRNTLCPHGVRGGPSGALCLVPSHAMEDTVPDCLSFGAREAEWLASHCGRFIPGKNAAGVQ